MTQRFDYIIVGSGIAGLYAALLARRHGTVCVLTKGGIDECNTKYAQGGIAAAVGSDDDPELHYRDTIEAGAGLVDPEAARVLVDEAAERLHDIARGQLRLLVVPRHEALPRDVPQHRPLASHRFRDEEHRHPRQPQRRRMKLDELHVRHVRPRSIRQRDAIARRHVRVGAHTKELADATGREDDRTGIEPLAHIRPRVERQHARRAPILHDDLFDLHILFDRDP